MKASETSVCLNFTLNLKFAIEPEGEETALLKKIKFLSEMRETVMHATAECH